MRTQRAMVQLRGLPASLRTCGVRPLSHSAATFLQGTPPDAAADSTPSSSASAATSTPATAAARLPTDERDALEYALLHDARKPARRRLKASSARVGYEAKSSAVPHGYQYAIGVHNKRTGEVTLMETHAAGVFGLQLTRVSGNAGTADSGGMAGVDDRARRDMLISSFGSRKKQKMDASAKSNIVDVASVAAAGSVARGLSVTAATAAASASASTSSSAAAAQLRSGASDVGSTAAAKVDVGLMEARTFKLPPFDLSATSPAAAYPLGGVLPPDVRASLQPSVEELTALITDYLPAADGDDDTAAAAAAFSIQPHHVSQLRTQSGGSDFVVDRLSRLLVALAAAETEAAAAAAADADDSSSSSSAAGIVEALTDRLVAALWLGHLVALFKGPVKLAYRVPPPPKGSEPAPSAASAAASAASQTDAEALAEALASHPRVPVISSLRRTRRELVDALLGGFTEARRGADGAGTDDTLYARTPNLIDRLASHIAVLSMHVDAFSGSGVGGVGDKALLYRDLRMSAAELARYYREVGATVTIGGGDKGKAAAAAAAAAAADAGASVPAAAPVDPALLVKLPTPLVFPKLKLGARAKR